MLRGLAMDFPGDAKAREISDQYLFGPAFLVSPVTVYRARTKEVYLPAGTVWYDFWTGRSTSGGQTVNAAAPYDSMPIYVRAGAIIPFDPVRQYMSEQVDGST